MSLTKEARWDAEHAIFDQRGDGGVRAIRDWLVLRRGELNRQWPAAEGDTLLAMQGEARSIDKLVQVIEHGPSVKKPVPEIKS